MKHYRIPDLGENRDLPDKLGRFARTCSKIKMLAHISSVNVEPWNALVLSSAEAFTPGSSFEA